MSAPLLDENWRAAIGFEGRYEVSDLGRVRSLPRPRVRAARLLAANPGDNGYPIVSLRRDGQGHSRRVHVLVAEAFIGPRPPGQVIRHLDGDSLNNSLTNLAYGTPSENIKDQVRHGTHPFAKKTHCPQGHAYDEANTYYVAARPRSRYCRACFRDHRDRRRAAQRAAGVKVT